MYENYQNTVCINQEVFYESLSILSYSNFQKWVQRGKLNRIRTKGRGRTGLIEFSSIPEDLKNLIIRTFGNPYLQDDRQTFTNQIIQDEAAIDFYRTYKFDNGLSIPEDKQSQYICEAEILNLYDEVINNYETKIKAQRRKSKKGALKKKLAGIIKDLKTECYPNTQTKKYPHKLPSNVRALDRKLKLYLEESYEALIHKNANNAAAKKIKGDIANWILAQYSMPTKIVVPVLHNMYMREASKKDWPELSESAIYKWLYEPEQEKLWMLSRDGVEEYRKKYGHKLIRDKEQWFPNAYWAIDGTKIDWMHYYDNQLGAAAKFKIDPVLDVYSEKIIGWSFSETENHIDHFTAVKMAFQEAQCRPYLFTYDGQSGHTSNMMQLLYGKMIARKGEHYQHEAYAHTSPAEGLFNRLQQQVINSFWFSDKQSIKVRTNNNKPNMDFIMDNVHKLPKRDELEKAWLLCVDEWNNSIHPKFKTEGLTRNEVYNHEPLMSEPISYLDMIDLFWVFSSNTSKYEKDGIRFEVSKQKYHFEVYNVNGQVDLRFREKWVNKKFFIKYDPLQLDNYVSLYLKLPNGDKQFVADAQPKRGHQQVGVLKTKEGEKQFQRDYAVRKIEEKAHKSKIERIQRETGITPEQLIEEQNLKIKLGGKLPKQDRNEVEADSFINRL